MVCSPSGFVPAEGPWIAALRSPPMFDALPAFADIPAAGQRIAAGHPVLTMFANATTMDDCQRRLQSVASVLDAWLLK